MKAPSYFSAVARQYTQSFPFGFSPRNDLDILGGSESVRNCSLREDVRPLAVRFSL